MVGMRFVGLLLMVVGALVAGLAVVVFVIRFFTPGGGLAAWLLWIAICAFVGLAGLVLCRTGLGTMRQGSAWPR